MQSSVRTQLVWFLAALFLLSAGHGVFLHADHDHGPEHCALCVLAWTAAIASSAVAVLAASPRHARSIQRRAAIVNRAFAYSHGQRAPPSSFLL